MNTEEYFSEQRLNIELSFLKDDNEEVYCMVRLRPWKNKPFDGQMILAAGEDVFAALDNAQRLHTAGAWQLLDWSKRPTLAQTQRQLDRLAAAQDDDDDNPMPARKARKAAKVADPE